MEIKRLKGALLPILVIASLLAPLLLTAFPAPVEARIFSLAPGGYARSTCTLIVTDNECVVAHLGPNAYNINCLKGPGTPGTPSIEPEIYYQPGDLPPVMAAAEVGLGRVVVFGSANTFGGEAGGVTARTYGVDKLFFNVYKWLDQKKKMKILWYESHHVYFKLVNNEDSRGNCIAWANILRTEEGYTVDGTGYNKDDPKVYPITPELLADYSILQLNNPEDALEPSEISAINDWVRGGGGLFLVLQSDYHEKFFPYADFANISNAILEPLDVPFRFQDDEAMDNEEFIEGVYYPRMYYTDHEIVPDDVSLTISPEYQETWPGGSFTYDVAVQNIGPHRHSYTLEYGHTATDWKLEFSPYVMINVDPGEKRPVTLRITIPSDANIGAEDNVFIKVTSQSDPTITKNASCTLHAARRIRPPIGDAYTHEGRPDAKFGGSKDMYVGWYKHATQGVGGSERTWLKFDLSSLPADATIGRVRLWLYCYTLTGWGSHGTRCYSLENDDWTEKTIIWNNQPPTIGRQLGDAQAIEEAGKWYFWEVSSFVQSERIKDNLVSFCLIDQDENVDTNHSPWFVTEESGRENVDLWPYLEFLPPYDVDVSISPAQQYQDNPPGGTLTYTVTVKNTGSAADTYSLTKADDAGWPLDLSPSMLSLGVEESRTATLTVTIPTDALICTKDNVTVTATGTGVSDSASCVAHAFKGRKLQPIADAYVDDGFPGTNHGNDNTLYIQSHRKVGTEHGNENIYLKFDLSGIPSGSTIVGAEIWLWCEEAADANINAQCREVENDAWVEGEINWGKAVYLPGDTISTTLLEKDVIGWYFWDVTPFVLEQREVDNIVSFCIGAAVKDASGRYIFDSKEWPLKNERPFLKVTGENIPPENIENIPGVDVSISPGNQSGSPGGTLDYTVTVTNTGSGSDTYSLSATDTAGWTLNIPSTVGPLSPGASDTVTLRVAIPGDAENGATDSITVTATSQANTSISDSASCTTAVEGAPPPPTEGIPIVYLVAAVVIIVVIIAAVLIVKPF